MKNSLLSLLLCWLLGFGLGAPAHATASPATGRPLAEALNPDGTLRAGLNGSFDARQFRMGTAPDGRPVFRPLGTKGAGDERWQSGFGHPTGADYEVRAVVRSGNNIYIGGFFSAVGSAAANRVAKWDGTSWSNLGTGLTGPNSVVLALAVAPNGDLYAGGQFTQAGGVAASNVARWNGTAWSALGTSTGNGVTNGGQGVVNAIAVSSVGEVYVGGSFNLAGGFVQMGGVSVSNIAKWNGTAWSALSTGINEGVDNVVNALAVAPNGDVYVGGIFSHAGWTLSASGIAKWNGTTWSALGAGTTSVGGDVYALAIAPNGDVYVAGGLVNGLANSSGVWKWNGSAWSSLALNARNVFALGVAANGDVYVCGQFIIYGGATAINNVARWNGTTWSALAGGADSICFALAIAANNDVYVGGIFGQPYGLFSRNIMRWDGTVWNSLGAGNGASSVVYAVAVATNGDVYASGLFQQVGSVPASHIAKWNGTAWSALGSGMSNGQAYALAVAGNGDVYAGGDFTMAGGIAVSYVAKWNGVAWSAMGNASNTALNSPVRALAVASNGDVYAGGEFTRAGIVAMRGIARWNGTAWNPVGVGAAASNLNGNVSALAIASNGDVYIGGRFTQAGGAPAYCVARWNGAVWSSLGTGSANGIGTGIGTVFALAIAGNGDVYMGGDFGQAGGLPASFVAKWNGTAWSALGAGLGTTPGFANPGVFTLAVAGNGDVYAGGILNQSGSTPINYAARWNGSGWINPGTGVNGSMLAMAFGPNGKLYAGGAFTTTGDGSKAISKFAIYDPAAPLATTSAKAMPVAQLYPNPAHGTATLRLPAGAPRQPLTLTDALGRTVRRFPAPATAEAELDLRGLPAGAYVMRCGAYAQRLVVE
jgi:hypothetical protein